MEEDRMNSDYNGEGSAGECLSWFLYFDIDRLCIGKAEVFQERTEHTLTFRIENAQ